MEPVRVHIGSGAVYLFDYINVDVPSPRTFLAEFRPDLLEKLGTTEDAYYARHSDKTISSLRIGPLDQEYVCDRYGDFHHIPVVGPVDEILTRHSFEHLSAREARTSLDIMHKIMRPGGILRIDVPDHEETMRLFASTGDKFYIRHLLGPRRGDDGGYHVMSYDPPGLTLLVESCGFRHIGQEPNIHLYPAFCLRFANL